MTTAAFQAKWGSLTGNFKDNNTRDIDEEMMREMIADLISTFNPQEDSSIDTLHKIEDDFVGYRNAPAQVTPGHTLSGEWSGSGAGVDSSTFGVDSTENCQGVAVMSTGTTNTGRAKMYSDGKLLIGTGANITLTMRVALETLSDATNRYSVRIGLLNVGETHGAFFRYVDNVNSGKWEAVTLNSFGVETATDTGITADVTTYHLFTIEAAADGSEVNFYIDGNLLVTITTNIPTSQTSIILKILKSAGATSRNLYCDYYSLTLSRSTTR